MGWNVAMAKHRHRGSGRGRTTPKGTRPGHLSSVRDDGGDRILDGLIDSAGHELLAGGDPVEAEIWASGLLGVFHDARTDARAKGMDDAPFEEALLDRCLRRRDERSVAVASALGAVMPPPLDEVASSVVAGLHRLAPRVPDWAQRVGLTHPTRASIASDVFGDQDSLIIAFAQEGDPTEHALAVLVDHNLSGQAKDAWIASDYHDVLKAWKMGDDPHMRVADLDAAEALGRLRDAMAMSDLWNGDGELRTEDFADHRALVWARLRRAGVSGERTGDREVPEDEREAIVAAFMASDEAAELSGRRLDAKVEPLVRHLVHLRCDYEGRPLRWSPTVVAHILLDLAPRKLMLDADQAAAFGTVLRSLVRYCGRRTGLERTFVDETVAAVDELEPRFLERIDDPSAAGPAKTLLSVLASRGIDLDRVDSLEALNEKLASVVPTRLPAPLGTAARSEPAAKVMEEAAQAQILARFGALAEFYGDGRKLTQTGQPTLADARALVSLLGTRDRLDETIGDRTFKTRSAADLPELGFTIRWAIAAGALRKEHGKLRATAAWGKLEGAPVRRWERAAGALATLGPLGAFYANHRYRPRDEVLDELTSELLELIGDAPISYDAALDWLCERADEEFEWLAPYMQDPAHRRTSFGWDLDRLLQILGWAGIVERVGAASEPDRYQPGIEHPVGGTLRMTPLGEWWLGVAGRSQPGG
jgi:hypothetical protein